MSCSRGRTPGSTERGWEGLQKDPQATTFNYKLKPLTFKLATRTVSISKWHCVDIHHKTHLALSSLIPFSDIDQPFGNTTVQYIWHYFFTMNYHILLIRQYTRRHNGHFSTATKYHMGLFRNFPNLFLCSYAPYASDPIPLRYFTYFIPHSSKFL